jgi:hypothetical protein
MAIKGKGKTRQRTVARAPRREPVPVPVPFAMRLWVRLVAATIFGALLFMFGVWVTNGIRQNSAEEEAASDASKRSAALTTWKAELEGRIGKLGQIQPGVPPAISPQVTAAAAALAAGDEVTVTTDDLKSARAALAEEAKGLGDFDLSGTIGEQGFDRAQVEEILTSRTLIVRGLQGLGDAADVAILAMGVEDEELKKQLGETAESLAESSTDLITQGWRQYQNALADAGLGDLGSLPTDLGG